MGKTIYDSKEKFGGYFEEFSIGSVYKHWPGKTITESDNHLFSLITMNTSPLHIDENYMLSHQHGKILVCGPLVLSLLVGMSVSDTSVSHQDVVSQRVVVDKVAAIPGVHCAVIRELAVVVPRAVGVRI